MLKLSTPADLTWLDLLPGVRIQVRPITVAAMLIAREAVGKVLRDEDQDDVDARADVTLVRELTLRGIVAWEGIGNEAGEPISVSPAAIDMLLEQWPAYTAIDRLYVGPALARGAEKNASSTAPAGTSGAAPTTARPAAKRAQNARTRSTRQKRKTA